MKKFFLLCSICAFGLLVGCTKEEPEAEQPQTPTIYASWASVREYVDGQSSGSRPLLKQIIIGKDGICSLILEDRSYSNCKCKVSKDDIEITGFSGGFYDGKTVYIQYDKLTTSSVNFLWKEATGSYVQNQMARR